MHSFDTLEDALRVAQQVMQGEIDPNLGCSLIAEINEKVGFAPELNVFLSLAHDQYDHEKVGFTTESCVPEILDACRHLVLARRP
jgi:hypothetical protein